MVINVNTNINTYRFPEPKRDYCYNVGRLKEVLVSDLSDDILNDLAELHFTLKDKIADIVYTKTNLALEVMNVYKPILDYTRIRRIKSNLKGYKYKGIIVSRMSKAMKRRLKNIPILELGFQILPKHYASFYSRIHKTKHRRFVNKRTLKYLVNALFSFYLRIGVIKWSVSTKKSKKSYVDIMIESTFKSLSRDCAFKSVSKSIVRDYVQGFLEERVVV
ncbi:MAG: hypothetical protein QXP36_11260 [Conexivisphaerales archaeon]